MLVLIGVRWPDRGLSGGVRSPSFFFGNRDERDKHDCALSEFIVFVEYLDFQMNLLSAALSR